VGDGYRATLSRPWRQVLVALAVASLTPVFPAHGSAPYLRRGGVAATGAAFGFLMLLWPFAGAGQPFFTHGRWALLPMAGAAVAQPAGPSIAGPSVAGPSVAGPSVA
jgi:hypothetical protein